LTDRVGIVFGETTTSRCIAAVTAPTLAQDDFVRLHHPTVSDVLGRVSVLRRRSELDYEAAMRLARSDGGTAPATALMADIDIIGYFDRDLARRCPIPNPVQPGSAVERASTGLIRDVLGLERRGKTGLYLGLLHGHDLSVYLDPNDLLSKHFSIVARTGSGKSFLAGVIVEELLDAGIATVVIDPHGEYGSLASANTNDDDIRRMERFGISPMGYIERVFEFALPLDGEKSYAPGGSEYRFTITVPQSIQGLLPQGESMSGLMKVVRFLSSPNPVRWYLDAKLDVPKSVDVSKRVQINIV